MCVTVGLQLQIHKEHLHTEERCAFWAYLAILGLEKTTVGQVSKFSKVRREDVYRVV